MTSVRRQAFAADLAALPGDPKLKPASLSSSGLQRSIPTTCTTEQSYAPSPPPMPTQHHRQNTHFPSIPQFLPTLQLCVVALGLSTCLSVSVNRPQRHLINYLHFSWNINSICRKDHSPKSAFPEVRRHPSNAYREFLAPPRAITTGVRLGEIRHGTTSSLFQPVVQYTRTWIGSLSASLRGPFGGLPAWAFLSTLPMEI